MKIVTILGTRPEVIKLAPVVLDLHCHGHKVVLCNTERAVMPRQVTNPYGDGRAVHRFSEAIETYFAQLEKL